MAKMEFKDVPLGGEPGQVAKALNELFLSSASPFGLLIEQRRWMTVTSVHVGWTVLMGVPSLLPLAGWQEIWYCVKNALCASDAIGTWRMQVVGAEEHEEVAKLWEREMRLSSGMKTGSFEAVRRAVAGLLPPSSLCGP
jgi:hypothetical protein